jgi:MFS family permease
MSALTGSAKPEQRKAAIALNRLAVNLGMGIGPAIGGFLALVSFPLLFVVDGVTSLVAAATLTILVHRQRQAGHPSAFEAPVSAGPKPETHHNRSVVWRDRRAVGFFVVALLLNLVYSQEKGAMPLYLVRDLGYRESFFGAMFIINTMTIVAIEVPLNIAMAHWPAWKANALSAVLIGVGFGAMAVVTTPIPLALTVIVWTFGEMIFFPTATAYMAELAPAGRIGEYMGGFTAMLSLAIIVGPWAGTTLLEKAGPQATWGIMLGCGLLAAVLLVATHPREKL